MQRGVSRKFSADERDVELGAVNHVQGSGSPGWESPRPGLPNLQQVSSCWLLDLLSCVTRVPDIAELCLGHLAADALQLRIADNSWSLLSIKGEQAQ